MSIDEFEPPFVHGDQSGNRSAQVIQIDSSKHVAAIAICAVVCGVSAALSVWAAVTAQTAATEYRVVLNHYMHLEAQQEVMLKQLEEKDNAVR